jgi:hypothetical protein
MLTDLGSALSGLSGSLGYEQSLRDYFTALLAAHGGERAAPA